MTVSSGSRVAEDVIEVLKDQIAATTSLQNPYQARHTLDALSAVAKGVLRIFRDRPGLESVQQLLDDLVKAGQDASSKVPRICPECDSPHHDSKSLCQSCQNEQDWQDAQNG